ncbi:MAG: cytidylate kinase family protein [Candidatus Sulfotelmatobacter sp.]
MKTVRVITIAREYGSGGAAIGQELAAGLGWKLLDRELILELAHRAHVQPSEVSRIESTHARSLQGCSRRSQREHTSRRATMA